MSGLAAAESMYSRSIAMLGEGGLDVVKHYVLEAMVYLAAARGQAEQAAQLYGSFENLKAIAQVPSARILFLDFSEYLEKTRSDLGDDIFQQLPREGARMGLEAAIACAFNDTQYRNTPL